MYTKNLAKIILKDGGKIVPLIIPSVETGGTGLMNPSVYNDNGNLLVNVRHVNYTLYHAENNQIFYSQYGPLAYLNPENDLHLRTNNFLCKLNNNYEIEHYSKIDTSKLDKPPLWEFIGLEDGRLVRWDDRLWLCGVRRDTTTNGQGRMELSEIVDNKEINRYRIEPPNDPNSYCEKNWIPVIDMPYHFIKWTNPTELVKVDINTLTSKTIYLSDKTYKLDRDLRGGSQIISYKDGYVGIMHEVSLFKSKLQQKDATYTHKFVYWNKDWNIIKISNRFSFMTGEIEFCTGLTKYNDKYIISFGFQDNAAYLLITDELEKYINID